MTNIEVYILPLENDEGTRVKVGGYEVDEEPVEFGAAADIKALKNWIVNQDQEQNRKIGLIIVYTPPVAAGDGRWIRAKLHDKLTDGQTYGFIDLAPQLATEEIRKRKERYDDMKAYHQAINDSGSSKSSKLLKVRNTGNNSKRCFLCGKDEKEAGSKIEASHVFQKQDVYMSKGEAALDTFDYYKNWARGQPHWNRPFEMHGYMNLIWLCHHHNLQFDSHRFGLTLVDLEHTVRFISYDRTFDELVQSANARLGDPNQPFYDMSYLSRRAIGMRMREAKKAGHIVDGNWEAVVGLSEAASVSHDGGDGSIIEEELDSRITDATSTIEAIND